MRPGVGYVIRLSAGEVSTQSVSFSRASVYAESEPQLSQAHAAIIHGRHVLVADAQPLIDSRDHFIYVHGRSPVLVDHLVRPLQERRRDREAEGLGGLEADDQLKAFRPLHG
jgi:hypothetical protein